MAPRALGQLPPGHATPDYIRERIVLFEGTNRENALDHFVTVRTVQRILKRDREEGSSARVPATGGKH